MAGRFGNITSSLSIGAGESIRRNAGDTAFEAFSPAGIEAGYSVPGQSVMVYTSPTTISGSRQMVWYSASNTLTLQSGSSLVITTGSFSQTSGSVTFTLQSNRDRFSVIDASPFIPGETNSVIQVFNNHLMITGSTHHYWNNPLDPNVTQNITVEIERWGPKTDGPDGRATNIFYEIAFSATIPAGQSFARVSASAGGNSISLPSMTGSMFVEATVVGIESGSKTFISASVAVPTLYAAKRAQWFKYKGNFIEFLASGTNIIEFNTDNVNWGFEFVRVDEDATNIALKVMDNGEGSIWTGTLRAWMVTDKMGRTL